MIDNLEIAKALFDEKLNRLIESVEEKPKTVKEMAAEFNEKPSRLYYPIQKLMKLGLLKVDHEEMIGNLTEKYYTSAHLEDMSMEGEFARENKEFLLTQIMASLQRGIEVIRQDLEAEPVPGHSSAMYDETKVSLTHEEWHDLNKEIADLIKKRSRSSEGTSTYTYSLLTYKTEKK